MLYSFDADKSGVSESLSLLDQSEMSNTGDDVTGASCNVSDGMTEELTYSSELDGGGIVEISYSTEPDTMELLKLGSWDSDTLFSLDGEKSGVSELLSLNTGYGQLDIDSSGTLICKLE